MNWKQVEPGWYALRSMDSLSIFGAVRKDGKAWVATGRWPWLRPTSKHKTLKEAKESVEAWARLEGAK